VKKSHRIIWTTTFSGEFSSGYGNMLVNYFTCIF